MSQTNDFFNEDRYRKCVAVEWTPGQPFTLPASPPVSHQGIFSWQT